MKRRFYERIAWQETAFDLFGAKKKVEKDGKIML